MNIDVKKSDGSLSKIIIGDVQQNLPKFIDGRKVIFITDDNVYPLYGRFIGDNDHIIIGTGEKNKTLDTMAGIFAELIRLGADRGTFIIGLGGGIVTDITGFAASTYMRGCRFGFIATTLLSQVDASVGGKNGVNFEGYKNMVGVFNQPDFVICDTKTLNTLPEREIKGGMAEILKMGLIGDGDMFETILEKGYSGIINSPVILEQLILTSIAMKATIVESDERETGVRKKLNLGHTLAHAIEKCTDRFHHGEAVAIGLCMAADISEKLGYLKPAERQLVYDAVRGLGLPTESGIDREKLFDSLKSDKKKNADSISFIIMKGIGRSDIIKIGFDELHKLLTN